MGIENRGYVPPEGEDPTIDMDPNLEGNNSYGAQKKRAEVLLYPEVLDATQEAVENSIKQVEELEETMKQLDPSSSEYSLQFKQWEVIKDNLASAREQALHAIVISEGSIAKDSHKPKTEEDQEYNKKIHELKNRIDEVRRMPGWMLENEGFHDIRNFATNMANSPEAMKRYKEQAIDRGDHVTTDRKGNVFVERKLHEGLNYSFPAEK